MDGLSRNRYLLCLLASGMLLYYAVPRLSISAGGAEGLFSLFWLALALMVIAGNLTGLLYTPIKKKKQQSAGNKRKRIKARFYQ
ncbi:hypothetical protein R4Z09_05700 [Niallia oryzisoli]|uniref:Permease n=1 Tax=Niallia oryzisoli TaxID=1737571 RepID=A0ABZ2CKP2_9BACI